jgi:ubiquinone/menaquinone biosynthesis C-methylase UbiE
MRTLDYVLQEWRYHIVAPHIPRGSKVLDIGGFDGSFLQLIQDKIEQGVCIDPLIEEKREGKLIFIRSQVAAKLPFQDSYFDVVTMLAVYEHLGADRENTTQEVFRVLNKRGRALLTVPHHAVDHIVHALKRINLIHGMSLEEHDHFRSSHTIAIFKKCGLKLEHQSKFQMGLNRFFIFNK